MLEQKNDVGLVRELNPGPLAPEARIIPLDQRATYLKVFATSVPHKIIVIPFTYMRVLRDHANVVIKGEAGMHAKSQSGRVRRKIEPFSKLFSFRKPETLLTH